MKSLKTLTLLITLLICITTSAQKKTIQKEIIRKTLFDELKTNLEKQMNQLKLNGLSYAVFENHKIIHKEVIGIKASDSNELINTNTAFNTASISKPITALLCALLEEKGLIDLEAPISTYLKNWTLPESKFTTNRQISWKDLLSHTAGTSQHGFADFYEGDTIPSIIESLQGKTPRYNKEIEILFTPGTDWKYSGGGYVIVQLALEDYFKKSISKLAKEYIFNPLKLKNTTMVQPHEKGFLSNVAKVHDKNGLVIKTGLPITPQVSASGMWSTPSDMAMLCIEIQNALQNKNNTVISNKVAKRITNIVSIKTSGGASIGWARAFGFGNIDWFSHSGSNTGVGGDMMSSMTRGNGFVIFANGEKPNRFPILSYTKKEIIKLMDWENTIHKKEIKDIPSVLIESIKGNYIDFLYGEQNVTSSIVVKDNRLYLKSLIFKFFIGKDESEMVYLGHNTFKIIDYPNYIKFNLDNKNQLTGITFFRDASKKNAVTRDIKNIKL
ncbi:serine hydrolase domain-containing protein [uncultured Algibacter sp.]|uniref:serine hydrolase domain-containing protein n=1 Tax=uncultured Algibacter sp. TaxID=298659 RepID=UPI0032167FE7